jgi:hypothetical protein
MSDATLYEVLGVTETASPEEITAAYRRLVRLTHPDAGGSDYLFRRVAEANKVLSDPRRRAAYDRECSRHAPSDHEYPDEPADVTVDDGWTRVDDPPQGSPQNVSFRDRVRGWDWRHRRYNPTGAPHVRRRVRDVIGEFFAARPWLFVLGISIVIAHRVSHVAALLFALAVVARIGSRRAKRRRAARRVKPGQFDVRRAGPLAALSLFVAQVVSGVVVCFLFLCAPLRRRAERRRLRSYYSDWL